MNIYELEERATPGPFEVAEQRDGIVIRCPEGVVGECVTEDESQLFAHCRNNFMKALRELKWCADRLSEYKLLESRTIRVINEMEEVSSV